MHRLALMLTLAGTAALATPLAARGQAKGPDTVPAGHVPPPGMCRVWVQGVPPSQQPAPTDCATAVRNRPSNGRVIFGDDVRRKKLKGKVPAASYRPERDDRFDRRRVRDTTPAVREPDSSG